MFGTQVIISMFEFVFTVVVSALGVYMTYRVFVGVNPDYDSEEELRKGNTAVAVLLAAILISAGLIIQKGIYPVVALVRLYVTSPVDQGLAPWQLALYAAAHLVMSFALAVLTISFTLRLWGRLTANIQEGKELKRGNMAVGIVLASVVLLVSMFIGEGVSSLSKSLIPQPSIGKVRVMR